MKKALLGKTLVELEDYISELNGRPEHAFEVAKWLYKRDELNFGSIHSIPLALRQSLDLIYFNGK